MRQAELQCGSVYVRKAELQCGSVYVRQAELQCGSVYVRRAELQCVSLNATGSAPVWVMRATMLKFRLSYSL